jgi:hypothetical protein
VAPIPEVTDAVTVKEVLGHQSLNTTIRYTHPGSARKRGAIDQLLKRPTARETNNQAVPVAANDNNRGVGHNLVTMTRRDVVEENVV